MAYVNFAVGTLKEGIAFDDTSCELKQGHGTRFLSAGIPPNTATCVIWDKYYANASEAYWNNAAEIVTAVFDGTDVVALTRAQESTTARDFNGAGHEYEIAAITTAALFNFLAGT